ncbi:CoA transferase [Brevibacillus centrosporus]|uniref:CaiB/BaiF CoA transferase family protein n=1 Tax=Brevibacillus centrosporus TaxID=54910 RepID=UPI000F0A0BDF|nr:CoA transferase [Brevibacillus centrosporus]MEC2130088.1 CoA transferase [Brevibacillus centrosporus]MED4906729.1 CoA transferase [Brevibacillus centrosporus]RNB65267.1 CoA transferase [Brevibacillus centrosporus]GED33701.1 CoA transferase [Brevibacillus centrosporus]
MQQALQHMRVIDLTQVLAGPYCTMVLGDLGADVIKVEKYPNGDDSRIMGPYFEEESYSFMMANRNKRGIRLNIKEEAGREILYDLVRSADVLIENYRPGVTKKLGIDYETLRELNPGLIYCSISGYGQTGPYSHKGGYDIMAQGLSGLMSMTGEKNGRPVKNGIAIHDIAAGVTAIYSIMAAYIHKMTTGEGQHIDLSLVDSGLAWTVWESAAYFGAGEVSKANGSAHRVTAPYQGFSTKNGNILVGAGNQKLWEKFCKEVIGREELIDDPRFLTNSERTANLPELEKIIESVLVQQDSQYWLEKLDAAGVPSSPIYQYDEALNDPHIRSRDMVIEYEHPLAGTIQSLGFPAKFSQTPGQIKRPAPLLGQHTREVLQELQYSEETIRQLEENKVI